MKHRILTVLLCLGVVGGLAAGFHQARCHQHHRAHWKEEVADICVQAAARTLEGAKDSH